ncbi:MAG: hypothetical protein BroJett038_08080 [Chloroflexota bacterium]|nr:MAG: hypothetical protein BroJett038_08080 [Chloroflexota bacterium]
MYLAQQINIPMNEIIARLAPRSGIELLYDICLYIVFFLCLIVMFMQSDKQLVPTILAGLVGALAVIAKLNVFDPKAFGSLVINATIFVFPIIVAGITKAKRSQPLAIIAGVFGGVYFFMFWFISQRG